MISFLKDNLPHHTPHKPSSYATLLWFILNVKLDLEHWPYTRCDPEERKDLRKFNCCHICYKDDRRKVIKHTLCCYMTTHTSCMQSFLRDQMEAFNYRVDSCCPFCSNWYMGFAETGRPCCWFGLHLNYSIAGIDEIRYALFRKVQIFNMMWLKVLHDKTV